MRELVVQNVRVNARRKVSKKFEEYMISAFMCAGTVCVND